MDVIVCVFINGCCTSSRWSKVFKELEAGAGSNSQAGDAEACTKYVVQMFLFGAVVFTLTGDGETECIAIKFQSRFRITNDHRCVVDSEKKVAGRSMPFRCALIRRELQNFERMAVRVREIERANAGSRFDVLWKSLWPRRSVLHLVLSQPSVSFVHVACNDGDMLKPAVVAAGVWRHRPSFRRQIFSELDELGSQSHADNTHAQAKYAFKMFVVDPGHLHIRNLYECQDVRIKVQRPVHIGNSHSHRFH